jgi:small subunit ribosomal protein S16
MATKIRLQRRGRTHYSEFSIVVADSKSPRDGKFIEKIGLYNPNTNPATMNLDFERALYWVQVGAQPSETAKAILSHKGVLMMDHLLRGVKKGAFNEETAKAKFVAWEKDKSAKETAKKESLKNETKKQKEDRLKEEQKIKEERAKKITAKYAKKTEVVAENNEETTEKINTEE